MDRLSYQNHQPQGRPWGWALGWSLVTHLALLMVLVLIPRTPRPTIEPPGPIRVRLISPPPDAKTRLAPKTVARKVRWEKEADPPAPRGAQPVPPPRPKGTPSRQPRAEPLVAPAPVPSTMPASPASQLLLTPTSVLPAASEAAIPADDRMPQPADQIGQSARTEELFGAYALQLREQIDRAKRYPLVARKAGRQGSVLMRFRIAPDGRLLEAEIVSGSGHSALDRAALKALERAGPFAPLPAATENGHPFSLRINFSLEG